MTQLILASGSLMRRNLLSQAGYDFDVVPPGVDEEPVKDSMLEAGASAAHIADALAELKAVRTSAMMPDALVIGADQTLEFDGQTLSKCQDLAEAKERLTLLAGKSHKLHAAVVIAVAGQALWRFTDTVTLTMKKMDSSDIDRYLSKTGEGVLSSVGVYEIEKTGIHLFDDMKGNYWSILGLPLLPLVRQLRIMGFQTP